MQLRHKAGLSLFQLGEQDLPIQAVVAVPAGTVVETREEGVRGGDVAQPPAPSSRRHHRLSESRGDPVEHAGARQELAQARIHRGELLLAHVVGDVHARPGGSHRVARLGGDSAQAQPGQPQTGDPPLGTMNQPWPQRIGHPAHLIQQLRTLLAIEGELARAELDHLAGRAEPWQRDPWRLPAGQHDQAACRGVFDQPAKPADRRRDRQLVDVVKHEHRRRGFGRPGPAKRGRDHVVEPPIVVLGAQAKPGERTRIDRRPFGQGGRLTVSRRGDDRHQSHGRDRRPDEASSQGRPADVSGDDIRRLDAGAFAVGCLRNLDEPDATTVPAAQSVLRHATGSG